MDLYARTSCVVTSRAPFKHVIAAAIAAFSLYHQKTDGAGTPSHAAELAQRLSSHVASPSRTEQEPTSDRSQSRENRSRTGHLRVERSGSHTQCGPGKEPDNSVRFAANIDIHGKRTIRSFAPVVPKSQLVFHIKNARLFCLDKNLTGRMPR
jgi:hypothetical protein